MRESTSRTTVDLAGRLDHDLLMDAAHWENAMYDPDDDRGHPAFHYDWEETNYPLVSLGDVPDDWKAWMDDEIAMWVDEGQPDRFSDLFDRPIFRATCIVEIDGVGYLWDGYHRTAATSMLGQETIRSIVGRPKPEYFPDMSPAPSM